jgi:hypothetical protein
MAGKFTFFELENVIGDMMDSVLGSNVELLVMPVPNSVILNPVPVLMAVVIVIFGTFGVVQVNVALISLEPAKTDSSVLRVIVPQTIPVISLDAFIGVRGNRNGILMPLYELAGMSVKLVVTNVVVPDAKLN